MQTLKVENSSTIAAIRYDEATSEMQIDFKHNEDQVTTYRYEGVSKEAWDKFTLAESKGRHFAAEIKLRYQGTKLQRETA